MGLCGTGIDHCCYFKGATCPFVTAVDKPPFKWTCSLREELGSWESVHKDIRYTAIIPDLFKSIGLSINCGEFPSKGVTCGDCSLKG